MATTEGIGCSDHHCELRLTSRGGQGTNGGCRCLAGLTPEARGVVRGWRRELARRDAVVAAAREYARLDDLAARPQSDESLGAIAEGMDGACDRILEAVRALDAGKGGNHGE